MSRNKLVLIPVRALVQPLSGQAPAISIHEMLGQGQGLCLGC